MGKGCVGWARSQGGAAKLILASGVLSMSPTQATPGLRKQSRSRGGPTGGRDKASISSWGHLQLQSAPLSLRTVGCLSEALVGTAICISFYGFIFALFTSLCFPRVASGVNVSFE